MRERRIKCIFCKKYIPLVKIEDENTEIYYCSNCKKTIYRLKTKTISGKDRYVKVTAINLPFRVYFKEKDGIYQAIFRKEDADKYKTFFDLLGIPYDEKKGRVYCRSWKVRKEGKLAVLEVDGKELLVTEVHKL